MYLLYFYHFFLVYYYCLFSPRLLEPLFQIEYNSLYQKFIKNINVFIVGTPFYKGAGDGGDGGTSII